MPGFTVAEDDEIKLDEMEIEEILPPAMCAKRQEEKFQKNGGASAVGTLRATLGKNSCRKILTLPRFLC